MLLTKTAIGCKLELMNNPVKKLIDIVGTQAVLAKKCHVTQQSVYKWLKKGKVPIDRVLDAVEASNGKMTPEELCPTARIIIKATSRVRASEPNSL